MSSIKKNWRAISKVTDERLRHLLVACKGTIMMRLVAGFPDCFLAAGEEQTLLTREELFRLIRQGEGRRDSVINIITDLGIPHQRFGFSGHPKGSTSGVPFSNGTYRTPAHGTLQYFYYSSATRGAEVEYKESIWIVIWNGYSAGASEYPATHSFIIVPAAALAQEEATPAEVAQQCCAAIIVPVPPTAASVQRAAILKPIDHSTGPTSNSPS